MPPTRVSPRAASTRAPRLPERRREKSIGATRKKRIGGDEDDDDATTADERATKTTARSNAAMARRLRPRGRRGSGSLAVTSSACATRAA